MDVKRCRRCELVLPVDKNFYRQASTSDGFNPWCRECYRQWHRNRYTTEVGDEPRSCAVCDTVYAPKGRRPSKFCSRACKDQAWKDAAKATLLASKASRPARSCVWCSAAMPTSMRTDAKFCSAACNSHAHAATRKAAQRAGLTNRTGDLISLAYIAGRDRWRCGLCGGKVSALKRHPDPLAPSVDHIVPLASGGSPDEPANLQLSHLRCNLSKRDRPAGEQLRLIG